jgi:DNA-binding NarL/FixJ family response regulator
VIRIVLADDQAVVRDGLAMLLGASADIEVAGAAENGEQALALCLTQRPDVALLDLRMPLLGGAEATARLAEQAPGVRVLVLTTFADDEAMMPALRAGAVGYLTKDASGEQLVAAIRDVAAGRTVLDPAVQRRLVQLATGDDKPTPQPAAEIPADGLTRREIDVVRLVAEGLSNQQIARRLVLGEATVKTHLNHVLSKLDVDGRPSLVAWAWRHGYGPAGQ